MALFSVYPTSLSLGMALIGVFGGNCGLAIYSCRALALGPVIFREVIAGMIYLVRGRGLYSHIREYSMEASGCI